jgi:hypothetical protein
VTGRQPDLVITIGGPPRTSRPRTAMSSRQRSRCSSPDSTPATGRRLAVQPNQVVVDFNLHPAAVVADILRLL